jgi:hypothetical protein
MDSSTWSNRINAMKIIKEALSVEHSSSNQPWNADFQTPCSILSSVLRNQAMPGAMKPLHWLLFPSVETFHHLRLPQMLQVCPVAVMAGTFSELLEGKVNSSGGPQPTLHMVPSYLLRMSGVNEVRLSLISTSHWRLFDHLLRSASERERRNDLLHLNPPQMALLRCTHRRQRWLLDQLRLLVVGTAIMAGELSLLPPLFRADSIQMLASGSFSEDMEGFLPLPERLSLFITNLAWRARQPANAHTDLVEWRAVRKLCEVGFSTGINAAVWLIYEPTYLHDVRNVAFNEVVVNEVTSFGVPGLAFSEAARRWLEAVFPGQHTVWTVGVFKSYY